MSGIGRRQFVIASGVVGCSMAVGGIRTARAAPKYVAKISTSPPAAHPSTQGLFALAELVKQRTNGEVELRIFPSGQIASDGQALQQMKLGSIEASSVPISQLVQYVPEFAVCELPYAF